MEHQGVFIGMGINPDGPDLPVGLGTRLAEEPQGIANYGRLTKEQQLSVIQFIQGCKSGEDAQARIDQVVQHLKDGNIDFMQ